MTAEFSNIFSARPIHANRGRGNPFAARRLLRHATGQAREGAAGRGSTLFPRPLRFAAAAFLNGFAILIAIAGIVPFLIVVTCAGIADGLSKFADRLNERAGPAAAGHGRKRVCGAAPSKPTGQPGEVVDLAHHRPITIDLSAPSPGNENGFTPSDPEAA